MAIDGYFLEGKSLTHTFGQGTTRTTVLRDVSVGLRPGELGLIMGPSGSGKSTLLAILSGLLRPACGQVLALGEDLWCQSARTRKHFRQRHFGFIFQGYNLFPALTARQQLEIVLRWGERVPARLAQARADEMLELLGLAGKETLRPAQLSGGEKQRVAIGRALIKQPVFCFADEPTSALDWAHGRQAVELLRAAATEQGAAVLIVSHDARIEPYADQVYHLEDGCLQKPCPGQEDGGAAVSSPGPGEDSTMRKGQAPGSLEFPETYPSEPCIWPMGITLSSPTAGPGWPLDVGAIGSSTSPESYPAPATEPAQRTSP
jgi:putative ABC transport system ATP-binding protein